MVNAGMLKKTEPQEGGSGDGVSPKKPWLSKMQLAWHQQGESGSEVHQLHDMPGLCHGIFVCCQGHDAP